MGVKPRLARLEAAVPKGCTVCRRWHHVVMVDAAGRRDRPERCPGCGRLVPVTIALHIVGVNLDRL